MREQSHGLTRRAAGKLVLALPFAATAAADEKRPPERPSPQAECLAAYEPGLSVEEEARLKKALVGGEKSLAVIRDFKLPPDVAPSLRFAALKSRKR